MNLRKLFFLFSLLLISISSIFTYINYKKNLELLIKNKQNENAIKASIAKQSIENILNNIYIKFTENKELHKKLFFDFANEVSRNKNYDLKQIQEKLNSKYKDFHFDLFLINKDFIIFDTTYDPDLNLNFKYIPSAIPTLKAVYNKEIIHRFSSPLLDISRKDFIQYQLYKPDNVDFMVQMGITADKDKELLNAFESIKKKVPDLKSYNIYLLNNKKNSDYVQIDIYFNEKLEKEIKEDGLFLEEREKLNIFKNIYKNIFNEDLKKLNSFEIKDSISNKLAQNAYLSSNDYENLEDSSNLLIPVNFYMQKLRNSVLGYYLIIELDNTQIKKELRELKIWNFVYIFFLISILTLILYILYKKVFAPIFYIKDMMQKKSKIEEKIINSNNYELGFVMKSYNELLSNLKSEIDENISLLNNFKIFTSNSIHQIRIPLSVIKIYNEMISNSEIDAKENIKSSVITIEHIYDNMAYKVRRDYLEFNKENLNVSTILKNRISLFSVVANANDKEFIFDIDEDAIFEINKTELEYIIDNNLSNAIKYGKHAKPIYVSLKKEDTSFVLKFCNEGNEIKDKEKIFIRYERENPDDKKGHGIGLDMVKEICIKYDISIETYYKENKNCFKYSFKI